MPNDRKKIEKKQPALKSYFFGDGYIALKNTIVGAFKNLWKRDSEQWHRGFQTTVFGCAQRLKSVWVEEGILIAKPFRSLYWIALLVSIAVCGTFSTLIISLAHIVVLFVIMVLIYIGFSIVWLIDRIYLAIKKISTVCSGCEEHFLIPTYICPNCGVEHTRLMPGVYGILHRRCNCGNKLPTTFLNGRNKLAAKCPICGNAIGNNQTSGKQICIPVVGGPSVGKTAFITAVSYNFIEKIARKHGWKIEMMNSAMSDRYSTIKSWYQNGTVPRTMRSMDATQVSSIDLSFRVTGESLDPLRIVHMYDVPGEVFSNSIGEEQLRLYKYTHGLVVVIDPFSIPDVMLKYESQLSQVDKVNVSDSNMSLILDTFMNKLRDATGLPDDKLFNIPAAVIINKADSANLISDIGQTKAKVLLKNDEKLYGNLMDNEDYLCRKFLHENGLDNVITLINNKFKVNRYFACSSIGHEKEAGEYSPVGVMKVFEWLMNKADSNGIGKAWNDTEFTREPFALKKNTKL